MHPISVCAGEAGEGGEGGQGGVRRLGVETGASDADGAQLSPGASTGPVQEQSSAADVRRGRSL